LANSKNAVSYTNQYGYPSPLQQEQAMAPNPEPAPFTPVPTRKHIAGWTVDKQFAFLRHLAAFGSVAAAARSVGMSEASAWRLRARPRSDSFCRAWDIALQAAGAHLFGVALDRALNGSTRQYWKDGELVAEQVAPSDKLLMWAVDRLRPRNALRPPNGEAVLQACSGFVDMAPLETDEENLPTHLAPRRGAPSRTRTRAPLNPPDLPDLSNAPALPQPLADTADGQ
jgi:hypothetical protein